MCDMDSPHTDTLNDAFTTVSAPERRTIEQIVERALRDHPTVLRKRDRMDLQMDLIACHMAGCKLDLDRLLAADDANFAHDVFGIRRHIDRDTGRLMNFFWPRFSSQRETQRQQIAAAA